MDLHERKSVRTGRKNNIGEPEDRISKLDKSILHHILSFLDIKCVARTSLLSKRWHYIWISIPTLDFTSWNNTHKPRSLFEFALDFTSWNNIHKPPSLSEVDKFMAFVDRTLLLHDVASVIQKFSLRTDRRMDPSRVHAWISNVTRRHVEELVLDLYLDKPISVPVSLFTCESLVKLELNASMHISKTFAFPKLKSLTLRGIQFTDDYCWNEHQFSDCPVLESLILEECTWFGATNFCISAPALKLLQVDNENNDGLQDCALKINTPNLVSLEYSACSAKEYALSNFESLEYARVKLVCYEGVPREQHIGYGAAGSKFVQALSHVRTLDIYAETFEVLSFVDDFASVLPTFHNLHELVVKAGKITDESLFPLLKAVPNLKWLVFEESCIDNNEEEEHKWAGRILTTGCMLQHLESLSLDRFSGSARQMRWVNLILKNAKDLKAVELLINRTDAITKEILMSELQSIPRASGGCEFKLEEHWFL